MVSNVRTASTMPPMPPMRLPSSAAGREKLFEAGYTADVLPNCGHFLQREAPGAVIAAVRDAVRRESGHARREG